MMRRQPACRMVGYVKKENIASHRAFLSAGYAAVGEEMIQNQQAIRYELAASGSCNDEPPGPAVRLP